MWWKLCWCFIKPETKPGNGTFHDDDGKEADEEEDEDDGKYQKYIAANSLKSYQTIKWQYVFKIFVSILVDISNRKSLIKTVFRI